MTAGRRLLPGLPAASGGTSAAARWRSDVTGVPVFAAREHLGSVGPTAPARPGEECEASTFRQNPGRTVSAYRLIETGFS